VVELSKTHRKILDAVYRLEQTEKTTPLRHEGFSYRKIGEEAGCSYETVRRQKTFLTKSVGFLHEDERGGRLSLVKDAEPSWWSDNELLEGFPHPDEVDKWWSGGSPTAVDSVDSGVIDEKKRIDAPNWVSTAGSDKESDMSTPLSPPQVDSEKPIDMPNTNGKGELSTLSAPFESAQDVEEGEEVDFEYVTEDE
jgi:hypothetical protein